MSDIYYIISYLVFFCLLVGMGVRSLSPNVNLVWSFLVVERGLKYYSMSLHQLDIPSIPKHRNEMYKKKTIMNRDISILSFTFIAMWEQNVHFILLSIAHNATYLKFLFLPSFLPPELIWDSTYSRGMRYYLHFRGHIRLTNYNFCAHVESVSLFTTIFVILTNTNMWKVQNSTILEGLEYPILSRRVLQKSPQKLWEFPPCSFSDLSWFDVPHVRGLWCHQPFREPLRLTNYNFHTHVQYCVTLYYYIYHMDTYRTAEVPKFHNYGRLGISYFE